MYRMAEEYEMTSWSNYWHTQEIQDDIQFLKKCKLIFHVSLAWSDAIGSYIMDN
jgi:hypothetical protein